MLDQFKRINEKMLMFLVCSHKTLVNTSKIVLDFRGTTCYYIRMNNTEKQIRLKLLIKRLDNVNKIVYNNPTMSMFNQSKLIKKMNKEQNLDYNNTTTKENTICQK